MASRDRTATFVRYRAEARSTHQLDGHRWGGGGGRPMDTELRAFNQADGTLHAVTSHGGGGAQLPPRWVDVHEEIREHLGSIDQLRERLTVLRQRLLLPTFAEKVHEEEEIDRLTGEVTRLLQRCEVKVRQLGEFVHEPGIPGAERTIRANVQKKYAMEVQQVSAAFRREQRRYLDRLKAMESESATALVEVDSATGNGTAAAVAPPWQQPPSPRHEQVTAAYDPGFSHRQLSVLRSAEAHADERYQQVTRISRSIQDLASVVRDLATLVVEQGTVLDRIDYNIQEADVYTERAVEHLRQARRSQKRGLLHYCTLCLAVACVLMFLLLLLKLL
ncbi:hypothetical protein CDCA_CDCA19G4623 [Cyanidium caldarium]|uniref:t-SNARE coiled-coil homology domain-containing protein n=1 Tax=Cyanidium caldarium TaxID=2771 RepID=A0AAV9J2M4_CYACA|nr:hypothetical protein CDCA_CDCA19G4623 [Cyanidium caldarium]